MTVYCVAGKLGSGKSLAAVDKVREACWKGRPVASNMDYNLTELLGPYNRKARVIRIPDHPTSEDLDGIGYGSPDPDEDTFGWLILDEAGTWLNARTWNGQDRQKLIDWLIHARKRGWHVILIVQHFQLLDKQVRDAFVELYVTLRRLDRIRLLGIFKLPRVHAGVVKYGTDPHSPKAEVWLFRARDLYKAYDTRQVYSPFYPHGVHCLLTPWHTHGRYLPPRIPVSFWLTLPLRFLLWSIYRLTKTPLPNKSAVSLP